MAGSPAWGLVLLTRPRPRSRLLRKAPVEELAAPFRLRVVGVLDLQPSRAVSIESSPTFRDDPFEIQAADLLEQRNASLVDVIHEEETRALSRHQLPQLGFTLDERKLPQIVSIQPQQVERVEKRAGSARHQLVELGAPLPVETDDLAIQHRFRRGEVSFDRERQGLELVETVTVARDQSRAGAIHIGDGAKAVMFELEEPLWVVEGLGSFLDPYRSYPGEHLSAINIKGTQARSGPYRFLEGAHLEILILFAVAVALVLTLAAVFVKLLLVVLVFPFKIFGMLASGGVSLFALGFKLFAAFAALAIGLVIVASLPILLPVAIASGVTIALLC